jgi:hypothetical protein
MNTFTRQRIEELKAEVDQEWVKMRRIQYLKDCAIPDTVSELWASQGRYGEYLEKRLTGDLLLCGEYLEGKKTALKRLLQELNELTGKTVTRKSDITPEMIKRAKAYPFQKLFEFRNKSARCPFHDDRDPSFALMKDNTVRCFGACGRSWDTIDFVMERKGKTFKAAVKWLQ